MEKIENIVDIGCGQCYLSTHLAFNEHFQVLAIDRDLNQIKAAKDRSVKLQSVIKDGTMGYQDRLSLIHEEVDDSFLEEKFGNRRGNDEDVRPWCMTSLHACGGLSVSMIKSFVSLQQCCLLVNLGCCYHLLDKELIYERGVHYDHEYDSDNAEDNAFPISKAVKCLKGQLSYSLRSLACQVPHRWLDDDFNPLQGLVITFNRSLFQVIHYLTSIR
jgi:predicted RNA methylase